MNPTPHLSRRSFGRFYTGTAFLYSADQFISLTLVWGVLRLTSSPLMAALALILNQVPTVVVGLVGPHRAAPRHHMSLPAMAGGVLVAGFAVASALKLPGDLALWALLAAGAVTGWVEAILAPLAQASLMQGLPEDARVMGSRNYEIVSRFPRLVSPLLGGALLGSGGLGAPLGLAAVALLGSGVAFRGWPIPHALSERRDSGLKAGRRALGKDSWLKMALSVRATTNFFWPAFTLSLPLIAMARFHGGAFTYGVLLATYSLGTLLSTIALGQLARTHLRRLYFLSWSLTGMGFIGTAFSPTLALAIVATFVAAVGGPVVHMALDTHIGTAVNREDQASLFAFQRLVMSTLSLAGFYAMGLFLSLQPTTLVLGLAGGILVTSGLLGSVMSSQVPTQDITFPAAKDAL